MKHFLLALQFLTIIPVRVKGDVCEKDMIKGVPYFVFIGLIQGILLLSALAISEKVFHQDLSIFIVIILSLLLNGAFHLDGLADTFDAIAVKRAGNRQFDIDKRLNAMKDSHTGAIGVTAIVSLIALKYLALKNISHLLPFVFYSSLIVMPVLSKWAMVCTMFHGRPAKKEGLGYLFLVNIDSKFFLYALVTLIFIYFLIYGVFYKYLPGKYYIFFGVTTMLIYFLAIGWSFFCNKKFGGSTGDTLGAISEISEVIFLLMVIIWSRLFIS